jgi:anti-anti-sigma regulatory factor
MTNLCRTVVNTFDSRSTLRLQLIGNKRYKALWHLARRLPTDYGVIGMLKISIIENGQKRQLVLEGKLVAPWTNELKKISQEVAVDPDHRELVIDLRSVTVLSAEGEDVLLALADQGARFRVSGVFMRQVVKQLSRRSRLAKGTSGRTKA